MFVTHSAAERRALIHLHAAAAEVAAHPHDTAARVAYLDARQTLREHARAGALIARCRTLPAPRVISGLDYDALRALVGGAA